MRAGKTVVIPYKFVPRPYQGVLFSALDRGYLRIVAVWHRRAGKDKTLFNLMISKTQKRVGIYYYLFPEYAQGERDLWDGMDKDGMKFLDHLPPGMVKSTDKSDMKIFFKNGSMIQIVGTDRFDRLRGPNPVGCVFSEYAFQNPLGWSVIRPILRENGGWAIFNSTPNGRNHFHEMTEMARRNPRWFLNVVTVEDSVDEHGNRYLTDVDIQEERDAGATEEEIQREYYCSFDTKSEAYFFLSYMASAENEGRICKVPHDPGRPVQTWWDIGVSKTDATAIWFTQSVDRVIHVIDYYEGLSKGLPEYVQEISRKPYLYASHNFPHDIVNKEWGNNRTRLEVARELLGSAKVNTIKKISFQDGINAVRVILPKVYFDKENCKIGINALRNYKKKCNRMTNEYTDDPVHDFASHASDAFRYFALGYTFPRHAVDEESTFREQQFRNEFKNRVGRARSGLGFGKPKSWMAS